MVQPIPPVAMVGGFLFCPLGAIPAVFQGRGWRCWGRLETEKARSCQPSAALGKRKSPAGGAPGFGKEGVVNGAEILGHWGGVNVYH